MAEYYGAFPFDDDDVDVWSPTAFRLQPFGIQDTSPIDELYHCRGSSLYGVCLVGEMA